MESSSARVASAICCDVLVATAVISPVGDFFASESCGGTLFFARLDRGVLMMSQPIALSLRSMSSEVLDFSFERKQESVCFDERHLLSPRRPSMFISLRADLPCPSVSKVVDDCNIFTQDLLLIQTLANTHIGAFQDIVCYSSNSRS